MLENKNYEWVLKYDVKENFWCSITEGLYFFNLYTKLMRQGTQKDKLRLVELFNEAKNHNPDTPFIISLLTSLLFSSCNCHEHACRTFIYELKMKHYNDEQDRRLQVDIATLDKRIKERNASMKRTTRCYNLDNRLKVIAPNYPKATKEEDMRYDENNNPIPLTPKEMRLAKPLTAKSLTVKTLRGPVYITYILKYKTKGWYTYAYEVSEYPYGNKQAQVMHYKAFKTIEGEDGVIAQLEKALKLEEQDILCTDEAHEKYLKDTSHPRTKIEPAKNTIKKAKIKKIDISKINKALGIEETEDLNGNIF